MRIALSKVREGLGLAAEIVKAADQANNADGASSPAELRQILDGEGYRGRHVMRRGTLALQQYAYRVAGSNTPGEAAIDGAARRTLRSIEKAAAKDGIADQLSRDEFQSLPPTAKRLVEFSARYAGRSIDELFF